jgi:hypothetical protein
MPSEPMSSTTRPSMRIGSAARSRRRARPRSRGTAMSSASFSPLTARTTSETPPRQRQTSVAAHVRARGPSASSSASRSDSDSASQITRNWIPAVKGDRHQGTPGLRHDPARVPAAATDRDDRHAALTRPRHRLAHLLGAGRMRRQGRAAAEPAGVGQPHIGFGVVGAWKPGPLTGTSVLDKNNCYCVNRSSSSPRAGSTGEYETA